MARTEREKMLAGELYLASDPELLQMRRRARELTAAYNRTAQDEAAERARLLRALLGRCGAGVWVEPPFYCDYGVHTSLGDAVYLNFNCVFLDCAAVEVGDNVKFGPAVQVYAARHPVPAAERIAGPELASPVRIGRNCWIGGGAILCPGVTIGDNTTVGAGSVVVRDLPANVVAVGNPCRVVRRLPSAAGPTCYDPGAPGATGADLRRGSRSRNSRWSTPRADRTGW
jgi:maltose O-acetyltransferase